MYLYLYLMSRYFARNTLISNVQVQLGNFDVLMAGSFKIQNQTTKKKKPQKTLKSYNLTQFVFTCFLFEYHVMKAYDKVVPLEHHSTSTRRNK